MAANGLLLLLLTVNVSRLRIKNKVAYGDGENKDLMKAIRVHCNGTEQVPVYGLLILALCFVNSQAILLALLVCVFTFSRIIHAYGMLFKVHIMRRIGAALTYFAQAFAVFSLIFYLAF